MFTAISQQFILIEREVDNMNNLYIGIDNAKDLAFELAVEELARQELEQGYTDEEIEEMYERDLHRRNIGNPMAIMGAV
jgi:hypothetical protein